MDVFISYERSDRNRAMKLAEALEKARCSVWWDRKLAGGEHFGQVIQKALDASKCVVVLWSTKSVESD